MAVVWTSDHTSIVPITILSKSSQSKSNPSPNHSLSAKLAVIDPGSWLGSECQDLLETSHMVAFITRAIEISKMSTWLWYLHRLRFTNSRLSAIVPGNFQLRWAQQLGLSGAIREAPAGLPIATTWENPDEASPRFKSTQLFKTNRETYNRQGTTIELQKINSKII